MNHFTVATITPWLNNQSLDSQLFAQQWFADLIGLNLQPNQSCGQELWQQINWLHPDTTNLT